LLPDVHDEMVESPLDSYLPGIIDAVQAATAGFLPVPSTGGIVPGLHRDPHDLVPLVFQQHSRDRGVDASAHSDQYSSVAAHGFGRKGKGGTVNGERGMVNG